MKNMSLRLVLALAVVFGLGACAPVPREPAMLPAVEETFGAPYERVWEATLAGLGGVRLPVVDKAGGRISTEPFGITVTQPGVGTTQVLWVALDLEVARVDEGRVRVRVHPRVDGPQREWGGPDPRGWASLFARIRQELRHPG